MSATLQFQDDSGNPLQVLSFGAIALSSNQAYKCQVENTGDSAATSVVISLVRQGASDGVTRAYLAPDASGSPGTYSQNSLVVGTIAPGATFVFWTKVQVPSVDTPFGNPRQFVYEADFFGT